MTLRTYAFPRTARLIKTDEFSSVFALRPVYRSRHFVIYLRQHGQTETLTTARLGVVIGKKFAKRAVERNVIKRIIREWFRPLQAELAQYDVVVRLHAKFPRVEFTSRRAIQCASRDELLSALTMIRRKGLTSDPTPLGIQQP